MLARSHALVSQMEPGRSYQEAIAVARGDVVKGLALLHAGVDDRGKAGLVSTLQLIGFLTAEALAAPVK